MAALLVSMQIAVTVALATGAGPGKVWTGGTWQEANDQAIYIGDVEQIRSGALGVKDLYAPMPQTPFWHPTFVLIGLVARITGMSSVVALTGALWLATAAAVFLLHSVSRAMAKNEQDASMATLLILVAGGFGWVATIVWQGADIPWRGHVLPDLASEAFLSPNLYMGPHVILAYGLLPYVLLCLWRSATSDSALPTDRAGWVAAFAVTLVHPYVVPTIGLFIVISLAWNGRRAFWNAARSYVPYGVAMCVGAIPHVWSQFANASARGLLMQNNCPIEPVWIWFFAFAPWIGFILARLSFRMKLRRDEMWIPIWLVAAILAVALPFKWDIKIAESWHAALVWLAIPVLVLLRDRFCRVRIMTVACVVILSISSVLELTQQLPYARGIISDKLPMYANASDMDAWKWVRANTPPTVRVLPPNEFVGIWSAPFMQRSSWIGHPFDTPDYEAKKTVLPTIPTMKASDLVAFLDSENIGVILTPTQYQTEQYVMRLSGTSWHIGANFDGAGVLIR